MSPTEPRRGSPEVRLDQETFKRRFLDQFPGGSFAPLEEELQKLAEAAWQEYESSNKSPRTHPAGDGFADPTYQLSDDWRAARTAIRNAQARYEDKNEQPRLLVIAASGRNEHTCPGEMSKTYRLATLAVEEILRADVGLDFLDLSRLTSEYGRHIHPCKACFSTSPALCHWPCSCYPNYALGQVQDWMNDIYPLWVAASGVLIVTPVNWYQATSPLKLMMDRLVCADGGNPDPTRTRGKDARRAKEIELGGWPYPRHLAGRFFGLVVHGDTIGAEGLCRSLSDWLTDMHLRSAGRFAELDRYIGYWRPYATSHMDLDNDSALQEEVRNVARALIGCIRSQRTVPEAETALVEPRQK